LGDGRARHARFDQDGHVRAMIAKLFWDKFGTGRAKSFTNESRDLRD
jgi:hypothetical protein